MIDVYGVSDLNNHLNYANFFYLSKLINRTEKYRTSIPIIKIFTTVYGIIRCIKLFLLINLKITEE